jgi:uncharacterized RDD family membrane protein YckC
MMATKCNACGWDFSETKTDSQIIRYAGFGPRLGAALVDLLVFIPVILLTMWSLATSVYLSLILCLPITLFSAAYQILMHGKYGQTLGKMAMKIRVVQLSHEPITYIHAFWRHFIDLI